MLIGGQGDVDCGNCDVRNQFRRCADQRVMRAGKAECAVTATGMAGNTGRRCRCALGIVQAEFQTGRGRIGVRGQRKAAEYDQKALRRDRVSDEDADQWPPDLRQSTHEHDTPITPATIIGNGKSKVNVRKLERIQTVRPVELCYLARMSMKAWRRHSATSLLSWL